MIASFGHACAPLTGCSRVQVPPQHYVAQAPVVPLPSTRNSGGGGRRRTNGSSALSGAKGVGARHRLVPREVLQVKVHAAKHASSNEKGFQRVPASILPPSVAKVLVLPAVEP